ncbi:MAG: DUF3422 domain-containing protein [Hyphomicrobiaceae bacterium]|nr:DUF3422 domain-containing protein [Hyphomicrobiaceae bacterium]MCC0023656.1 DUF3422 domain-containing protein [Hyphomicrobiaceae bacterium]
MSEDHPFRREIHDEIHARPIVLVGLPSRVRRLVFQQPGPGKVTSAFEAFRHFCETEGLAPPQPYSRQHTFERDGLIISWEFHTEFITITWAAPLENEESEPKNIGLELVDEFGLVSASRVDVMDKPAIPKELVPGFSQMSFCHAAVDDGKAEIATDFSEDQDGFVRFELAAKNLSDRRRAILSRRLLEIETYAKMALLTLPMTRSASGDLGALETSVSDCIRKLPDISDIAAAKKAMDNLNTLSLKLGALSENLNYRIAAAQAYGTVLSERLAALRDVPTGTGSSLSQYLNNRVNPAIRTIVAFEKRLDIATQKVARAVAMLNARNGLELEIQNSEILNTISKTAHSQFQLQKTVEGLSAIAISYYLIGILSYALAGPMQYFHWDKVWTLSIIAPFVFLIVYLVSRRFWHGAE